MGYLHLKLVPSLTALFSLVILFTGCSTGEQASLYSGIIEGTEIPIQSELGGVVQKMLFKEGDSVKQGEIVSQLSAEEYSLQVAEAQAALQAAEALLEEAEAGSRKESIRQAEAQVKQAEALSEQQEAKVRAIQAQLDILEANRQQLNNRLASAQNTLHYHQERLQKAERLYQAGALAEQEVKDLRESVNQAQTTVTDLKQQLSMLEGQMSQTREELAASRAAHTSAQANTLAVKASLDALITGHTDFTLRHLAAQKEMASIKLEQAKLQLGKTRIRSPETGTIIRQHVHQGEVIKPGALVYTLLKKDDLEVVVYVPVTQLDQIKLGQTAYIYADAYPEQVFTGKVIHLASEAEFTPKNVQIPEERAKMVFSVTVQIDGGQEKLKPGMPADVSFTPPKQGDVR